VNWSLLKPRELGKNTPAAAGQVVALAMSGARRLTDYVSPRQISFMIRAIIDDRLRRV
jgi:hypothetical protein